MRQSNKKRASTYGNGRIRTGGQQTDVYESLMRPLRRLHTCQSVVRGKHERTKPPLNERQILVLGLLSSGGPQRACDLGRQASLNPSQVGSVLYALSARGLAVKQDRVWSAT